MADRENLTAKVWFRVEPSRRERWQKAIEKAGVREASDFYRDAIDRAANMILDRDRVRGEG